MKKLSFLLALSITGLICIRGSFARDMDEQYAVFGAGAENCAAPEQRVQWQENELSITIRGPNPRRSERR